MAATKSLLFLVLLVLGVNCRHAESKKNYNKESSTGKTREKRGAVAAIGVIGSVVGVAAAIQGAVCTFTDVCGSDTITPMLELLETKLDAIADDVTSIQRDVEDIWEISKRKWYFDHLEFNLNERKKVIKDLKEQDNSQRAIDTRRRFINEVLGGAGKDEYVEKALFHIPGLVTNEGIVEHHLNVHLQRGKSTTQAVQLTWKFIQKLFRYQENGYASVVLAASMQYKTDKASYERLMSQVCTWWSKSRDIEYKEFCTNFVRDPNSRERRKIQRDYIYTVRDLFLFPVLQVQIECNKFADSDGLNYAAGYLFVSQRAASKILIVNPDTLDILKTIDLPGSECGGSCHPFDVSIHIDNTHKLMAVAAQSKPEGGDSYVMMYNIKGVDLNEPSGLTIEHYYTMDQLLKPENRKPDVRSVAFCGARFAYSDYTGAIYNWGMKWSDSDPEPNIFDRYDWYIDRFFNSINGNIRYLGCSNSGNSWVVACSGPDVHSGNGVGAVPAESSAMSVNVILQEIADVVVTKKNWGDVADRRSRLDTIKGIAMDSKRNLFYSAVQWYGDGVSGIYQHTFDGQRRYIREWNHQEQKKQIFDMAVDDSGTLFVVQEAGQTSGNCLHKYDHEIDFEDINL